ncbi:MAG: anti-sigma factor antagonist [Firmicutes bacterium]|nr:anti-sigma factor antagonist [Bacillota bacterium]MDD4337129.1 anti-sigma factor antagonist [Bacillota bacterium]MDD4793155.1 anti-sigma factor antagonist [Bacillota bacterium]
MIRCTLYGKSLVLEVAGELDLNNAEEFRTALDSLIDSHPDVRQVVLCMDQVTFIDSSGIGVLFGRQRRMASRGGALSIASPGPQARRALDLLGVPSIMRVYDSREQALAAEAEVRKCTRK